jgi:hypothetical protein
MLKWAVLGLSTTCPNSGPSTAQVSCRVGPSPSRTMPCRVRVGPNPCRASGYPLGLTRLDMYSGKEVALVHLHAHVRSCVAFHGRGRMACWLAWAMACRLCSSACSARSRPCYVAVRVAAKGGRPGAQPPPKKRSRWVRIRTVVRYKKRIVYYF